MKLNTLRGTISEDFLLSTKNNSNKGISHKDIIGYLVPDMDLNCLKLADTQKLNEKLLAFDELDVSGDNRQQLPGAFRPSLPVKTQTLDVQMLQGRRSALQSRPVDRGRDVQQW